LRLLQQNIRPAAFAAGRFSFSLFILREGETKMKFSLSAP